MGHAGGTVGWLVAVLSMVLSAVVPGAGAGVGATLSPGTAQPAAYTDPFQYCAAVGTVDVPDERYTGPAMPESVALGLKKAFGAPADAPLEPFLRNSFWRCMDGKVYACTIGANLPCMERANTDRTPTQAMADFCKANSGAPAIPAYITGRATVYAWGCQDGKATVLKQVNEPDARGFLARFWYRIEP